MKNTWFIILLFLTSGLYALYPIESYAQFPGFLQKVEYSYSNDDIKENQIVIRSNPQTDELIIELTSNYLKLIGQYEIYNIFGKMLLNGRIKEKITTISITGLPKGIYIIHVIINKKQYSKKFIVK